MPGPTSAARTALFVLAPLVVLAIVFPLAVSMFPRPALVHDAYAYSMTAQRLVEHGYLAYSVEDPDWVVPPNAKVTPGWPLVLAAVHRVVFDPDKGTTENVLAAQGLLLAVMFLFSAGIVLAVTLTGREIGGETVGLAAGMMAALYPPFSWGATVSCAEHLGAVLMAFGVYFAVTIVAGKDSMKPWRAALLGALFGAIFLVRPNLVLWMVVPLLYVATRRLVPPKRLIALALAGALGFCLVLSPWWIRNTVVIQSIVLVKSNESPGVVVQSERVKAATPPQLPATDAYGWIHTSLADDVKILSRPWIPFAETVWENTFHYDKLRIDIDPETRDITEGTWDRPFMNTVARGYHILLMLLGLASLAFIKQRPRIVILAAAPVAVLLVHAAHLNTRFLYTTMPAMTVAAALAACAIGERVLQRRTMVVSPPRTR
ncbi:MAG: hypothetical protein ACYC77_10755 [Coriobacteriia bacterium]